MHSREDLLHCSGLVPEETICKAEQALGFDFPPSYRTIAQKYGAFDFGGAEFLGIVKMPFKDLPPDIVGMSLAMQNEGYLPPQTLLLNGDEEDGVDVLDCRNTQSGEEAPVILWQPGWEESLSSPGEIIAPSYGEYLLDFVTDILESEDSL
jgi:hypothetical protein